MAQFLSPVCTDTHLKLHNNPSNSFNSITPWRILSRTNNPWPTRNRQRGTKLKAVTEDSLPFHSTADDYYSVLGLLPDATPGQIKKAYYNCMKACHPDLSGDNQDTTNFCMFINEVYQILSDPVQRLVYDQIHGHSLTATNPFLDESSVKDHAFVDEFSCIGCKNCANVAPDVFQIEEDFGRARVCWQYGKPELVQQAIDTCPVDCIHWTSAAQVSLLEDEMRRVERVNVALMLAGMGASSDVFRMASSRWEKRQSKVLTIEFSDVKLLYNVVYIHFYSRIDLERARIRMMMQKDYKPKSNWSDLWGMPKDYENTEEEAQERARRAAAAARRWREYSRKGTDRPPTFKLPEAISNKE
ncbi:hypothetical protein IFM89_028429 [Coptis chinensis]|uniref:Uncharacterized protein n=1 Tax=Coptis chinensis TaxID=261450 RepID=A0A835IPP3_9MAGN|nr:hypothetical protein IFM89_028429 [Coptis chinensis]